MSSSTSLEGCSQSVVEYIVENLTLDDIRNLRLSCNSLAFKCSGYRFKTFFHTKHVDVTPASVREFAQDICLGGFRCQLRNLCLIGIVDQTQPQSEITDNSLRDEYAKLFSQAFVEIAKHAIDGISLTLQVIVIIEDLDRLRRALPANANVGWSKRTALKARVWQCTAELFGATMSALSASKLPIKKLDIFNGPDLHQCSLSCEELAKIDWSDTGLIASLGALKSLSISLSNPRDLSEGPSDAVWRADAEHAEKTYWGLARLIQVCNHLEELDLHLTWLTTAYGRSFSQEMILQRVVELDKLPTLKRCALHGIHARQCDLLAFIKRTKVKELHLVGVCLSGGTFRPIMKYCSSGEANMTALFFEWLHERHAEFGNFTIIFFAKAEETSSLREFLGFYQLQRTGTSVRLPIGYEHPPTWPIGSPIMAAWLRKNNLEFVG
ncbi:hypothetical protein FALBO_943 [Fusarium albosuccineum]|uniref:Uncharacterized protein n=1 Tax=Fusarium albosuccineum TaxID=1237068 RepID=A0A8H4LNY1_9HYPO|nr:hypothetical protein FALBO_943 [Fusarium albosuccineum]